jgi:hypothetical protein
MDVDDGPGITIKRKSRPPKGAKPTASFRQRGGSDEEDEETASPNVVVRSGGARAKKGGRDSVGGAAARLSFGSKALDGKGSETPKKSLRQPGPGSSSTGGTAVSKLGSA